MSECACMYVCEYVSVCGGVGRVSEVVCTTMSDD